MFIEIGPRFGIASNSLLFSFLFKKNNESLAKADINGNWYLLIFPSHFISNNLPVFTSHTHSGTISQRNKVF